MKPADKNLASVPEWPGTVVMRNRQKGKGMVMTRHNDRLYSVEFDVQDADDEAEIQVSAQGAIGFLAKKIAEGEPS